MAEEAPVRNATSGYWGRNLLRREVSNGVVQVHEADAPRECVVEHGHIGAHVVFVTKGAYVTSVTGENGFIARPVAVMNPPSTWHRDHFVDGTGSFMTVDLNIENLAEDRVWHDTSTHVLQCCHRLSKSLASSSVLSIEDTLAALAGLFTRNRRHDFDDIPASVARAYEAICDSPQPWKLDIKTLARIADVHPNHLPRAFRKCFGLSASQLASRKQIELCAAAIARCEEPLAHIAARFGFYDQAHMTARFRSISGSTPRRWRAVSRGG